MGLPIQSRAGAVVIDQGRQRIDDAWTALHPVAAALERWIDQQERSTAPGPRRRSRRGPAVGRPSDGGEERTEAQIEAFLQRLDTLGRADPSGLQRFLSKHHRLATALDGGPHRRRSTDRRSALDGLTHHVPGIPNAEGWA